MRLQQMTPTCCGSSLTFPRRSFTASLVTEVWEPEWTAGLWMSLNLNSGDIRLACRRGKLKSESLKVPRASKWRFVRKRSNLAWSSCAEHSLCVSPEQRCEGAVQSGHGSGSVLHESVAGPAVASHTASLLQATQDSFYSTSSGPDQQWDFLGPSHYGYLWYKCCWANLFLSSVSFTVIA